MASHGWVGRGRTRYPTAPVPARGPTQIVGGAVECDVINVRNRPRRAPCLVVEVYSFTTSPPIYFLSKHLLHQSTPSANICSISLLFLHTSTPSGGGSPLLHHPSTPSVNICSISLLIQQISTPSVCSFCTNLLLQVVAVYSFSDPTTEKVSRGYARLLKGLVEVRDGLYLFVLYCIVLLKGFVEVHDGFYCIVLHFSGFHCIVLHCTEGRARLYAAAQGAGGSAR